MGRMNLQHTYDALAGVVRQPIVLVCPPDEAKEHKRLGREVWPCKEKGISATRQWIMRNSKDRYVVMMDDDLTFYRRRKDDPTKFHSCTDSDKRTMLRKLNGLLKVYAHVGVAMREGANRNTTPVMECTRCARVIGYDREIFFKEGVDFRNSTVMDDFEATLALITRGYPNGVLNSFVQNQRGSGTSGGAAMYRTLEIHAAAAHTLAARYPEFVTPVQKTTKTAWGGATRTDVRVQWKKALQKALAK